jgi:uncharacterized protein YqeY
MITETIDQDFKNALREKDELTVSALRNLKAEIKNIEIAKQKQLAEDEVQAAVAKKVKQHKDSIESFRAANRPDLTEHEEKQMAVLLKYLPKQMDESEVRELVRQAIAELSASGAQPDFGKLMKEVMARAKGQTDGSVVSKIVKEELAK